MDEVRTMSSFLVVVVLLHRKAEASLPVSAQKNSGLEPLTFNFLIGWSLRSKFPDVLLILGSVFGKGQAEKSRVGRKRRKERSGVGKRWEK